MPKPYSQDLRQRVIEAAASRREAAELFGISPSVVVIWVQRPEATGRIAEKPSGGSVSLLEEPAEFLLDPERVFACERKISRDECVTSITCLRFLRNPWIREIAVRIK